MMTKIKPNLSKLDYETYIKLKVAEREIDMPAKRYSSKEVLTALKHAINDTSFI